MINSGKFRDHTEFLNFAGKSSNIQGDCVERCMKPEAYNKVLQTKNINYYTNKPYQKIEK